MKLDLLNEIHFQISDPTWSPADKTWIFGEKPEKKQKTQKTSRPRGPRGLASSLIMRPAIDRPCTPKCPGMYVCIFRHDVEKFGINLFVFSYIRLKKIMLNSQCCDS